jgi:very-short-patch-repair endonuclease
MFACAHLGAVGEFAASRHGVVTRQQAAEHGISAKVIRRLIDQGVWREPLPGVLAIAGAVDTWMQRLYIATTAAQAAGVASTRSAAALHRFDGYPEGPVELIVAGDRRLLRKVATVRRGTLAATEIDSVHGIRCTNRARTLVDLASVDPPQRVTQAFESAWRVGTSLTWIRRTAQALYGSGRSGPGVILGLVEQAERHVQPTESALELRLDVCLRGIPGVVRQHEIFSPRGDFVARVDFAVPSARAAFEAHSRQFHFGPTAEHRDETREHRLKAAGWDVTYFGSQSLRSPAQVKSVVLEVIERRQFELARRLTCP